MSLITARNVQRTIPISLPGLQRFAEIAFRLVRKNRRRSTSRPDTISVVIVSDRTMARLHRQFSNILGTTDVLTFHHGEIIISAETARRQARQFKTTTGRELRLYLLHGLLHLAGFEDDAAGPRSRMTAMQTRLFQLAFRLEKRTRFEGKEQRC